MGNSFLLLEQYKNHFTECKNCQRHNDKPEKYPTTQLLLKCDLPVSTIRNRHRTPVTHQIGDVKANIQEFVSKKRHDIMRSRREHTYNAKEKQLAEKLFTYHG